MKDQKITLKEDQTDEVCPNCGKPMVYKYGRYGRFMACSGYPDCKTVKKVVNKLGVACPKCEDGDILVRKTKRGKPFYGCSNYPNCNFASWSEPLNEKCPQCGEILFKKEGKKPKIFCNAEGCGYERELTEDDSKSNE